MAMGLDSAWPMGHLLRSLSIPEVLFEYHQLLEEHQLDLVQSYLRAITLMTPLGALVGWLQLERLFARRVNVETKDRAIIVGITRLPQLPLRSSLVRRSIFAPRTRMESYPTNTRTFSLSMWETWISLSFSGNAWKRLICSILSLFLPGLTRMLLVCWIAGVIGRWIRLTLPSTGRRFRSSTCVPGRGTLLIGAKMRTI